MEEPVEMFKKQTHLVGIIILNYNGWSDTIECIESILKNNYPSYEIIVVDNNSTDDSLYFLKLWAEGRLEHWVNPNNALRKLSLPPCKKPITYINVDGSEPDGKSAIIRQLNDFPVVFIQAGENLGYARGNNIGIRFALEIGADYICILNNDTIIESNFVEKMVNVFQKLPNDAAVLGPRILDYRDHSDWQRPTIKPSSLFFLLPKAIAFKLRRKYKIDTFLYRIFWYSGEESAAVYTLPGSCLFFKSDALKAINGFDERTFLYFEEDIVAEKLKAADLMEYFIPQVKIYHKWGKSIQIAGFIHFFQSSLYYYRQYKKADFVSVGLLKVWFLALLLIKFFTTKSFRNRATLKNFFSVLVN